MKALRRKFVGQLAALVALPAVANTLPGQRIPRSALLGQLHTSITAPDALSRSVLARRLRTLTHGLPKNADPGPHIHRSFVQAIDQNFACLSSRRATRLLDSLTERELSNLAVLYTTADVAGAQRGDLLGLLAQRLDTRRLIRLSRHFGFAPVLEAAARYAPQTSTALASAVGLESGGGSYGRAPQPMQVGGESVVGSLSSTSISLYDYTLHEIYLSFRTAPIGSMSPAAALYETAVFAGTRLSVAFGTAYAVGGFLVWGAQNFAPSLWEGIVDHLGGWMYRLVESFSAPSSAPPIQSPEEQLGQLQREGFVDVVRVEPALYDAFALDSGDFEVCYEWATYVPYQPYDGGGGNFCGKVTDCQGSEI